MSNFRINFTYPWLLLLFIPAVFIALFPYFRLAKKYRRTRNRIVSVVLHMIVITLSITALAGIHFTYEVPDTKNEVLLLVDVSESGKDKQRDKDEFIKSVIEESDPSFQLGVVTFGYDQVYAAPLSRETDRIYDRYLQAKLPDTSATDVASALNYTKGLFTNPERAKIVLIADGIETDGNALSAIKSVVSEGIKVDTVYFPTESKEDVQLIATVMPDRNITIGSPVDLGVTVQSSYSGKANITLYDKHENGVEIERVTVDLQKGVSTYNIPHTFSSPYMHELSFELENASDTLTVNNSYKSYLYLEEFNKLLILERTEGEASQIYELYKTNYDVDVISMDQEDEVPSTLEELRAYDQVILANIANSDMPKGFDALLHSYVYDVGGGLFTVGGNKLEDGKEVANAYNREDLRGTLYQEMLPVEAIDYTPPVGVIIIIDRSYSMNEVDPITEKTKLELAKEGAMSCLNALTERDWCGIIALDDKYVEEMEMTPLPQMAKIIKAIDDIEIGNATLYEGAIKLAGETLNARTDIEKKHIVLVTDGDPQDKLEDYGSAISHYNETSGITLSIVGINVEAENIANVKQAAEVYGKGRFYDVWDGSTLPGIMREELELDAIKEVNYERFQPEIKMHNSVVNGITQEEMPYLTGFYGTKAKEGAEVVLMGEYVPVYAQWQYGEGMVGSILCDLNGTWSEELLESISGNKLLNNIVKGLFPTESIRPPELEFKLSEDNYTTQLNVYSTLESTDSLEVTVTPLSENGETRTITAKGSEDYSRIVFPVTEAGLYEIRICRKNADGTIVAEETTYKTFSYSEEYDSFVETDGEQVMAALAQEGRGKVVSNPWEVFEGFSLKQTRTYDPRLPLMITVIVLFLLDVAVRKFKFKWIHELVREHRAKKNS